MHYHKCEISEWYLITRISQRWALYIWNVIHFLATIYSAINTEVKGGEGGVLNISTLLVFFHQFELFGSIV
jgi:hypothetical protein